MTGLTDAQAILQAARDRGDTRAIGAAQKTLRRVMAAELRADVEQRRRRREAQAQAARERSRRPGWWKIWGRR